MFHIPSNIFVETFPNTFSLFFSSLKKPSTTEELPRLMVNCTFLQKRSWFSSSEFVVSLEYHQRWRRSCSFSACAKSTTVSSFASMLPPSRCSDWSNHSSPMVTQVWSLSATLSTSAATARLTVKEFLSAPTLLSRLVWESMVSNALKISFTKSSLLVLTSRLSPTFCGQWSSLLQEADLTVRSWITSTKVVLAVNKETRSTSLSRRCFKTIEELLSCYCC